MAVIPTEPFEVTIDAHEAGERLDRVLSARAYGMSRSQWQRWIAEGRVCIDGEPVVAKTKLSVGDVVEVHPAPPPTTAVEPEALPLEILYEDADILVLNKAAGMVVHPAPGHPRGTLVNALLHHWQRPGVTENQRPGIVHRLDKDTSGIMVVAHSPAAHEKLVQLFQAHTIEREYEALVVGSPPEQVRFETLYGRHPVERKRFSSKVSRGKTAITDVRVIKRFRGGALIHCRLHTGRTHQIRVHCADHGFAVLGDPLYGKPPRDPKLRALAEQIGRQALHARLLAFTHPITGQPLRFELGDVFPVPQE